jgi:hypothetical protein
MFATKCPKLQRFDLETRQAPNLDLHNTFPHSPKRKTKHLNPPPRLFALVSTESVVLLLPTDTAKKEPPSPNRSLAINNKKNFKREF